MTAPCGYQNVITDQNQAVGAVPFYLWLANCYFSSHSACNIVHPLAGLARVALVVADFKGIRDG